MALLNTIVTNALSNKKLQLTIALPRYARAGACS